MSVLDVGCSTGHFLYTLKDHVNECIGIEYNQKEANFVEKIEGIEVTRSLKRNKGSTYEDLINLTMTILQWALERDIEGCELTNEEKEGFEKHYNVSK